MSDIYLVIPRQNGRTSAQEEIIKRGRELAEQYPISLSVATAVAADELINNGELLRQLKNDF